MQTGHKTWIPDRVLNVGYAGFKKKKFTDCVYIENVDEGVLTLSAFSVKVSVKGPFSEDFICQLLLSSRPLVGKVILSAPVYHNLLTNINH